MKMGMWFGVYNCEGRYVVEVMIGPNWYFGKGRLMTVLRLSQDLLCGLT